MEEDVEEYVLKIIEDSNVFDEKQKKVIYGNIEIISKVYQIATINFMNDYQKLIS